MSSQPAQSDQTSCQTASTPVPTAHVPTEGLVSPDHVPVRRALVSVYDKTGLVPLARALADAGVELVSTGSTAATIAAAGLAVTPVEEVTGFPECLEGRVKTLHPAVHAGILADRRKPDHLDQLHALGVAPIDLVIVNLYPFTDTVASGAPFDACVEQIDIGGPAMVRAAAWLLRPSPTPLPTTPPCPPGWPARSRPTTPRMRPVPASRPPCPPTSASATSAWRACATGRTPTSAPPSTAPPGRAGEWPVRASSTARP